MHASVTSQERGAHTLGTRDLRKAYQLLDTRVLSSPGDYYSANFWMTATEPSFIPEQLGRVYCDCPTCG